jgi:hypothetical protein
LTSAIFKAIFKLAKIIFIRQSLDSLQADP